MTEQELLAVLDMSEEEQYDWVSSHSQKYGYVIDPGWETKEFRQMSLADLAFRLRDEADAHRMHDAMYLVQQNTKDAYNVLDYATAFWGLYHAKPIYWIIAALIAKESK